MILDSSKSGTHDIIFPNQLLRDGGLALAFGDSKNPKIWSPAHIRHWFQNAMLKDTTHLSATLKNFDTSAKPELRPHQRMSFRKLMACYWDNSSFFSMDLVGAVIRQGVFVAKMHDIDWLHSPALHLTMQRLIAKYERFFKILAKYPKNMAVPTLDLDLGWHTHQLSPQAYYNYSTSTTKNVFIDHNDKIADSKLSQSFEWTSKMYQRLFGELYSECTCWYCEAIRESSRGHPLTRVFSVGKKGIESQLRQLDKVSSSTNPAQALHISAHNAINTTGHSDFESMTRINEQKLERAYQCACTQAKKVGRAPPKREAYVTRHGYYPYAAYPYCTPLHVTTPACSTPSPGAVGDCCAGTCVGGVAMGSCVAGWYCGSIADCGGGVGLGQFGGGCAKPLTHDEMFGMCG